MFNGSMVALVTPFKDGKVDRDKLEELVNWHIESGTSAIVPCGTTGESATLSTKEHEEVVEVVVQAANKRVPVIAGSGSNNTAEAIEFTKYAQDVGADGALVISPYYNKPTQNGLYEHFKAVAQSVVIPIMLYNIASRTAVNIEPSTMKRLSEIKNITSVKEASGNLSQMGEIVKLCGDNMELISGDDALLLPILSIGGKGVVSVLANIIPSDVAKMVKAFESGNIDEAREYHYRFLNLIKAMFVETNPAPLKKAMEIMGLCSSELRLPLVTITDASLDFLKKAMSEYGLIK